MRLGLFHRPLLQGLAAAPLLVVLAITAYASPGDDVVIVVDKPDRPELSISDLRVQNGEATHTPVQVRVAAPTSDSSETSGPTMRWAELNLYLTTVDEPGARRLSETPIELDSRWSNRSLVIDVASPGKGDYYVHVEGSVRLGDHSTVFLAASGAEPIHFGDTLRCSQIASLPPPEDQRECPILFGSKSSDPFDPRHQKLHAGNREVLDSMAASIDALCKDDALQRVSVRGWASTKNSVGPTNEELARDRAQSVVDVLRQRVRARCDAQIHRDTVKGVQAATMRFVQSKKAPPEIQLQDNRCAQIEITRHSCTN